jgi:hypothetical protein
LSSLTEDTTAALAELARELTSSVSQVDGSDSPELAKFWNEHDRSAAIPHMVPAIR